MLDLGSLVMTGFGCNTQHGPYSIILLLKYVDSVIGVAILELIEVHSNLPWFYISCMRIIFIEDMPGSANEKGMKTTFQINGA